MKKKKRESVWFSKPIFYSMAFLTFASVITSCTTLTSAPMKTVVKEPVVFDVPNIKQREFVFACDLVSGLYICDRLNERVVTH
jgi:hypothetical protein